LKSIFGSADSGPIPILAGNFFKNNILDLSSLETGF
jgi:hypothetical protein